MVDRIVLPQARDRIIRSDTRDRIVLGTRGLTGPPGPPSAAASYVQTFASPLAEWVVNHNLGVQPSSVVVTTMGGVEIIAERLHVNANQCRILFSQPQAGVVRCS